MNETVSLVDPAGVEALGFYQDMKSFSAINTGFVAGSMINAGLTVPEVPQMNGWTGAGSIFALFGNYYRYPWLEEPQADALGILSDWVRVGQDISRAMEKFEAETGIKPRQPPEAGRYRIVRVVSPSESQQLELF